MTPKCPTCGAPVDLAPDGDPRYDPIDRRTVIRAANQMASRLESEIASLKMICENFAEAFKWGGAVNRPYEGTWNRSQFDRALRNWRDTP